MRTYNKDLKKARRWLAGGRSTKVIRFLEPKVPLFLEDPDYYALLGRACLRSGLLKDADTYLNRGLQADPSHMAVRLTLAVNHLKRKDTASALRTWLEVLEDDATEKCARRGLRALKRISDQDQQDRFLERFDADRFLPRISSRWPSRILVFLIIMLLALTAMYFRDDIAAFSDRLSSGREHRRGMEGLESTRRTALSEDNPEVLYFMSDGEITRALRKALRHFQNYEDNSARFELNKIRYSNAAADIRDQAEAILTGLGEPDIQTIETSYGYDDVLGEPYLYDGCMILWKGRTANVVYEADAIRFDFLVGFEDGKILDGRVDVVVPFLAVMEPLPLELLARVRADGQDFYLEAVTLHFLR